MASANAIANAAGMPPERGTVAQPQPLLSSLLAGGVGDSASPPCDVMVPP
jgi:hypothetical protein